MLKGSICAGIDEKEFLEIIGVVVGEYNHEEKEFINCVVSDEAMLKLDDYWGRFVWSLF